MPNKTDAIEQMSSTELQTLLVQYQFRQHELEQHIELLESNILKKNNQLNDKSNVLKKTIDELNYSRHQLLEREAKLNSILNASIEGIIVIDPAGTIVSVNAAVENIFGYHAEELIGNSVKLLMPILCQGFSLFRPQRLSLFYKLSTVAGPDVTNSASPTPLRCLPAA